MWDDTVYKLKNILFSLNKECEPYSTRLRPINGTEFSDKSKVGDLCLA